ncbi:chloride channel protein [Bdellovibrio sp. HCB2-146]|uniref:chloride channel protein n=1 Tax=Bdellovibrio sp. HCB2-146 TaxID=3394362 RepID=UPI0039BCF773
MLTDKILKDPRWAGMRHKIYLNLPFWIAASLAALVSISYNFIFKICEDWAIEHASQPIILFTAPIALLGSFLIGYYFSKEALGSGIPQTIAAMELSESKSPLLQKLFSFPMLVVKIIGSCICVIGGGVSGREGPTLQVSAAIFYQLSRFWPKRLPQPPLPAVILAGGAAGIASAFNTPLGGIVFAIEELSKSHISLVRTAVFQAVIIAGILAQLFLGNYLYLGEVNFGTFPIAALLQTILIAGIVGVCGSAFAEALYRFGKWRVQKTLPTKLALTLLCGILLSATIYFCGPSTVGAGKAVMVKLLQDPGHVDPLLPVARIFGNLFTYTGGVVGGIFAPSLSSGAALGQMIANVFGFESVKLLILVGMVAFLTGITRTPFTSFVLVLEMSSSHDVILYLMLSSVIANVSARIVSPKGFYEQAAHDIVSTVPAT